jgi:hypothetical protein
VWAAAFALLLQGACAPPPDNPLAATPPHAPDPGAPPPASAADGFRYRRGDGAELIFDASRGAYRVAGFPHLWFHGEQYYRSSPAGWESGPTLRGPWHRIALEEVPAALRTRPER